MERTAAIAIEHTKAIEEHLSQAHNNFDKSVGFCPEFAKKAIWIYPDDFPLELLDQNPIIIEHNLSRDLVLYHDNGQEEIVVRNNKYSQFTNLYKQRTGKYDLIMED